MKITYLTLFLSIRFWARGRTTATPEAAKHFVESFTDYLNAVIVQADDRDNDTIHTIDSYFETRRENVGTRPSYVPGELHLSIPDEAFYHPVIKELEHLTTDLIILDNVRPSLRVFSPTLLSCAVRLRSC